MPADDIEDDGPGPAAAVQTAVLELALKAPALSMLRYVLCEAALAIPPRALDYGVTGVAREDVAALLDMVNHRLATTPHIGCRPQRNRLEDVLTFFDDAAEEARRDAWHQAVLKAAGLV